MSGTAKQQNASDVELWRVAESGDVDELRRVFANGAQVNARNKHGVTALMRAAYYGHARMVRALLDRGADPNLARNDKFTALALAAFFGHTETIKILIEHGARPEVLTRCGASAKMWATARTFVEAARYLEPRTPAPAGVPLVIKTLKDPPEIWDLVQEAPRGFNARSAFVSRLTSVKTGFAFRIGALVAVSIACVVSVLVLKGSQARSLAVEAPANRSVAATEISAPVKVENATTVTRAEPSAPEANELSHHSESSSVSDKPRKVVLTRQARARAVAEENSQSVQSREMPAAAPVVATPEVQPRNATASKPNSSLSPQLISPAKSAPPKGKVIQWP